MCLCVYIQNSPFCPMGWERPLQHDTIKSTFSTPAGLCERMFKHTPNALPESTCAGHMRAAGLTDTWRRCTVRLPVAFVGRFGSEMQVRAVMRVRGYGRWGRYVKSKIIYCNVGMVA